MTTITINNDQNKFSKTSFETLEELYVFLKEELTPLKLYLVDDEDLSEKSLKKIEESKNNPNRKLTDFQG